ncbi:YafY family protein [Geodermatophilus aquaeductus]|uniref:Predicted DNA-binding transcriptional regulator YafY, contains an HTH and WYL domains n=1 Tax=Geodermatophilus aquaeductus TaxID=1564161 RepID=A0A521F0X3_9ACTN|nr:YafY family protein [Geodermatophilus aquaeductus]SMO89803.1 Predicted DNA-binding transcriptional regulator YafY, contains an HTH and WYL domains [Geodermatophilus aquaeductus]
MSDPSARTLRLLSLLQARRYWSGADLAGRLGVSVRTLRRDVDRLRELGYPVEASRGVDGGYALAPGAALPPLVLDDDEAVALALGLQSAAGSAVAGMAETSVRALAKVVQVMPVRLRRRVEALRGATVSGWNPGEVADAVDPAVLTTVALACRDAERTVFGYAPPGRARTERTVEPHRLVSLGRRWYLLGWDLDRGDWRVFRLDRLDAPRGTGAVFGPRRFPAGDPAAYVRERIDTAWTRYVVEADVDAPADAVRRRIGRWATVVGERPGGCRVRIEGDDLDWAAAALVVTGAPFRVVSPPEFTAHVAALATRCAAAAAP